MHIRKPEHRKTTSTFRLHLFGYLSCLLLVVTGCAPNTSAALTPTNIAPSQTQSPTTSVEASRAPSSTPRKTSTEALPFQPESTSSRKAVTPSPTEAKATRTSQTATVIPATLKPDEWKDLPVVPKIEDTVLEIYARGLELGNNPLAFSKIGDCGSTPAWFLGDFDRGPRFYSLGDYEYLSTVIDAFQGSFDRTSLAARSGFNASALFVPLWADRDYCKADEPPLTCEYRVHKPVIAFIILGANDVWHPEEFEPQMRRIIEFSLTNGVIPILATKADNQEGDGSINAIIARLALEYRVPLWNFWRAVNDLPNQGLQEDKDHLTWGANNFDDPQALTAAWPLRNLTALQVLDAIWKKIGNR